MTNSITLTDDQLHWLQVALENAKENAQRLANDDLEDVEDGLFLVDKYNELQSIIGEPGAIGLNPDS